MNHAFDEIVATLNDYIDGFYNSDSAALDRVFHPAAHLYTTTSGKLTDLAIAEYVKIVANRPPLSGATSLPRAIRSIVMAGPSMAFAFVEMTTEEKKFSDLLILGLVGGCWRIIAKGYSTEIV